MVNIIKRTRKLQELLSIRCGPGALVLPKDVTKISMEFNTKIYGGHQGARKFWREMLPRIKYRNPAVPIQISRHTDPEGPSLLHIYKKTAATSTPPTDGAAAGTPTPPSGTPNARNTQTPDTTRPAFTLRIRDAQPSEILKMLIEKTGAEEVHATPEETQQMAEIKEFKERSEADRVLMRETLLKERREAELLRLARGEVPSAA